MPCVTLLFVVLLAQGATPETKPAASTVAGVGHVDYILQPGDKIDVRVQDQPALTDSMKGIIISQDYTVVLPYLEKPVDLTGATLRDAERLITARYKPDYLKNPTITVRVVEYVSRTVNVMGMVNNVRVVAIDPNKGLTLMDAITQAGGFNGKAKTRDVQVMRTNADGTKQMIPIDATELIKNPQSKKNIQLQPDDIINVPEIVF